MQDLDCQDLVEMVTEYFEAELAQSERDRLEFHLTECDGCTEYVAQMRTTIALSGKVDVTVLSIQARQALHDAFSRWRAR